MEKVQTPFPAIPSFNISAMILAYSGFEHQVYTLLQLLCRNTRLYSKSHSQLLRSFLCVCVDKLHEDCSKFIDANPNLKRVDVMKLD